VFLLLRYGADPKLRSQDGASAYKWAIVLGNAEAARAIDEAGGSEALTETEEFLAACAQGIVPTARPALGQRELRLINKLAEHGSAAGVRACLEAGFLPNTVGADGETPLHYACFCGWAPVVAELLRHEADLAALDSTYNASPLQWALHGAVWNRNAEGDYIGVVRSLLAAGADRQQIIDFADYGEIEAERLKDVMEAI
jgi:ankyrin repeat protein